MRIQFGTVDGLVNIDQQNILCLVKAIEEFSKQNGPNLAKSKKLSYGSAFQRFVDPVWNDGTKTRTFNISDIDTPVYTKSGKEQSPSRVTFCKKMGLLVIDDKKNLFELTPLGKAFLNKDITLQEYAFILISKNGVFKDGIYDDNVFNVIAEYFTSQPTISVQLLEDYISKKYSIKLSEIEKTRTDIIINAVEYTGLIKSVSGGIKVLANTECAEVFRNFQMHSSLLTPAIIDTDSNYSDYMGTLEYGIFDVMTKENAHIYTKLFPNLQKYIKDTCSINDGLILQQIFYGAPGTGKSHEIKKRTKGDDTVIRTTFHPDSDYSTFMGCYKPTMSDPKPIYGFDATGKTVKVEDPKGNIIGEQKIEYKFVKQAFTKAYIRAWKKMCDTSLWIKKAVAIPPTGIAATPYTKTGKIGNIKVFDRDKDSVTLLSSEEKAALLEVDNFNFPFDGINNFGELHDKIKVVVTDEPTPEQYKRYQKFITLTAAQIRDLYSKFKQDTQKYYFLESLLGKILEKLGWPWSDLDKLKDYEGEDITVEVKESNSSYLGLYDPTTKTVYLFKKNIGDDKDLLRSVYIHEMFHAYYDSVNKYIPEIEEPIVECNTLCFLELFDKSYLGSYKIIVEKKQKSIVVNYYGFGAHLYENRSLDWMRLYQNAFNQIDASSAIVNKYKSMFFPIYPFDDEDYTRELLYNILNPQYEEISIPKQARQYLIIEEINRGNCAQIFGDLFQLLDRKEGYSEYPIEADDDLKKILAEEFKGLNLDVAKCEIDSLFNENYPGGITGKIKSGELLVLPKNLYIWATMNTSDQSLFPIDSAFKRRWEWKYIKIKDEKKNWKISIEHDVTDAATGATKLEKYDWWKFLEKINGIINNMTSSADKQLGYFFCKANNSGIISPKTFVSKVLFYLWNDVFKDYGFDDSSLFQYKVTEDGKEITKDLTFPDFYDEEGEKVNEQRVKGFIENVMKWENKKEEGK